MASKDVAATLKSSGWQDQQTTHEDVEKLESKCMLGLKKLKINNSNRINYIS